MQAGREMRDRCWFHVKRGAWVVGLLAWGSGCTGSVCVCPGTTSSSDASNADEDGGAPLTAAGLEVRPRP